MQPSVLPRTGLRDQSPVILSESTHDLTFDFVRNSNEYLTSTFYLLSSWGIPIKLPSSSMAKNNLEGGASEIPMVRLPSLQGVTFVVSMVVFDVSRHGLFGCASVVWSSWEANRLRMTDRRKKSGQYYAFALFNSIWGHSLNMVWPVVETLVLSRAAGMYIINISID